jgi:effector-binding domain-containing protein
MIETPQIIQTEPQLLAAIHVTVPAAEMPKVMTPGFNELMRTLDKQGITPKGRWLNHHFRMPTDTFDFEIAMPVEETIAATERVKMSQLPATKALRTVYHGGYEGLGQAWGELIAWAKANDLKFPGEFWEQYTVGPEAGDPSQYRTELTLALSDE